MMTRDYSLSGGISGALSPAPPRGLEPTRAPTFASPGIASIDIATALMSVVASDAIDKASSQRGADHHEAEFAARTEQERRLRRRARRQPKGPPEPEQRQSPSPPISAAASPKMRPGRATMNAGLIAAPTETK